MEPTWVKLTILEELYSDILGTNYSKLMGPFVLMFTEEAKADGVELKYDEIDNHLSEQYFDLLNGGYIAELNDGVGMPDRIAITLKGREWYEQFLQQTQ